MAIHDQSYFPSLKDILSMFIQQTFPFFYDQTPPVSLCEEESLPNAEKFLREAYGLFDPTPVLLNLIKDYPTEAAVRDL